MEYCPRCMRPSVGSYCAHCGHSMVWQAAPSQLPVGTILNSHAGKSAYLLGAALGQGGFGITYIAVEIHTGERVAVKEYYPGQLASRDGRQGTVKARPGFEQAYGKLRDRFLEEAQILSSQASLSSVVTVRESFAANNTAYFVMEYLEGMTLEHKREKDGRIPSAELFRRMEPLTRDLARIHASGIIHRDISPDNLIWMPDGRLVLIDFGSARSMDNTQMSVLLKHDFAPIEQYQTTKQGPWTDVYALAATIYYCVTGTLAPKAIERLENDTLRPPRALGADLSPAQEEALLWGLAIQPKKRPQNVEVFADALFSGGKAGQQTDAHRPFLKSLQPLGAADASEEGTDMEPKESLRHSAPGGQKNGDTDPAGDSRKKLSGGGELSGTRERRTVKDGMALALAVGIAVLALLFVLAGGG